MNGVVPTATSSFSSAADIDFSSSRGIQQLLQVVRNTPMVRDDYNNLRDLILHFKQNANDVQLKTTILQELQAVGVLSAKANVGEVVTASAADSQPATASTEPLDTTKPKEKSRSRFGVSRHTPAFGAAKSTAPVTDTPASVVEKSAAETKVASKAPAVNAAPVAEPDQATAPTAESAKPPMAPPRMNSFRPTVSEPVIAAPPANPPAQAAQTQSGPAAEPVVSTPVVEPVSTPEAAAKTQSAAAPTPETAAAPVAEQVTLKPAPTTEPAPAPRPAQAPEPVADSGSIPEPDSDSTVTYGNPLERIKEIKQKVNEKVGNPINLIDANNAVGREYMNALLEAMKKINGGTAGEVNSAMTRLEAAYAAVEDTLKQTESVATPVPEPTAQLAATPVIPKPPVPKPAATPVPTPEPAATPVTDQITPKPALTAAPAPTSTPAPEPIVTASPEKLIPEPAAPSSASETVKLKPVSVTSESAALSPSVKPKPDTNTMASVSKSAPTTATPLSQPSPVIPESQLKPVPESPAPAKSSDSLPKSGLFSKLLHKTEDASAEPQKPAPTPTPATPKPVTPEPAASASVATPTPTPTPVPVQRTASAEGSSMASAAQPASVTPQTSATPTPTPSAETAAAPLQSVAKEKQLENIVHTNIREQAEEAKAEREAEIAQMDPLMVPDITNGLQQLLSEWSLFKSSGIFGTGPSGLEHPLYKQLAPLHMAAVIAGRFEGATPEVKQSVTDYMNGWRYEEGIIHKHGETFEHYLRRVIKKIIARSKGPVG